MHDFQPPKTRSIAIIPIGTDCTDYAISTANIMRKNNLNTNLALDGKVNKRMQNALAANASHIIFIGSDEMTKKTYMLKDLDAGSEDEVELDKLLELLKN